MEFNATFLATIISFIVFVFLMNKILYAPILGIMEERKNVIDSNYKNAEESESKLKELAAEMENKLGEAKDEARGKYLETVEDFKLKKSEIVSNAQNSANEEINRSNIELDRLSDEVKDGLKNSMSELANCITEKVIGYKSDVEGFDNDVVSSVLWGKD